MRRWILRVLIIAFVWVVATRLAEIKKLAGVLAHGKWEWVAAAFILQAIYYCIYAAIYQSAFTTVGVKSRWRELLPVTLGSLYVNVVAPAGGTSGAALFVDDAARRGESSARAAAGTLLVIISELGTFTGILVAGLWYLHSMRDLHSIEWISGAVLITVTLFLCGILAIGLYRPGWMETVFGWVQWLITHTLRLIRRHESFDLNWARKTASEFSDAAEAIRGRTWHVIRTLGVALLGHATDLACLYTIFRAFSQPMTPGMLIAGYCITILFWVVSITPQGVGVVEPATKAVYASLGVPGTTAWAISLAFRGLAFWLPMFIGIALLPKVRSFSSGQRAHAKILEVHIAAVLAALIGIINVLSAVWPALTYRLTIIDQLLPAGALHGARITAVLAGFGLIFLSRGLWRQKRIAWMIAVTLLIVSAFSHLLKGLDYEEAIVTLAVLIWIWSLRSHYHAVSDWPSAKQGLWGLAASLIFTILYGAAGFYVLDRQFAINYNFWAAIKQTTIMFTEFYNPVLQPITGFARYFVRSIYVVGAMTMGWAFIMLLRPVFHRATAGAEERARATRIVEQYGKSSLAPIALFDDKSYFFSSGGSVIAFVERSGIGLALGDPIGPEVDASYAIAEFKQYCRRRDWRTAFYQTKPDYLKLYETNGLNIICIGHEAIVNVHEFDLTKTEYREFRSIMNRLTRLEFLAEVSEPPLSNELIDELRLVSDEWLSVMHGTEKRFSLGWFDDDYIRRCRVMILRADDGSVVAFANLLGEYALNEVTIDLMRRIGNAPNGAMDFLFVKLFEWARGAGFDTFNLGLSPLAGIGEKQDDPMAERALNFVYNHVNQFYGFKGLHNFKEKFRPEWSPRYLIYENAASLLPTAYAIISADSGEGILTSFLQKRAASKPETKT